MTQKILIRIKRGNELSYQFNISDYSQFKFDAFEYLKSENTNLNEMINDESKNINYEVDNSFLFHTRTSCPVAKCS
jgi:hypothetical protein